MTTKKWMLIVGAAAFLVPLALALTVFPTAMIDTRELFAWGRFFPLATQKHPPMMALIGGLTESILPANAASAVLVGQLLNAVGVAYLYATLRLIVDRERAAFFTFLYATSIYFQLAPLSYALNADILQVPIWLAIVYHLLRAERTDAIGHWLAFGAWSAAAVLTKYTAGLLFVGGAIATLAVAEYRHIWRNPRLYLATAFGVLLVVPHLIALRAHPNAIAYAEYFARATPDLGGRLRGLAMFAGGTLLFLAPGWIILVVGFLSRNCSLDRHPDSEAATAATRRFLVALPVAMTAVLVALVLGLGTVLNHRYGAPLFGFFVIAVAPYTAINPATWPQAARGTVISAGLTALAVFVGSVVMYGIFTSHAYMQEPSAEAAEIVLKDWRQHYSCGPGYFLGDRASAHGMAISGDRVAAGIPMEDIAVAPWFDPALLKREGAIVAFRHPISAADVAALPNVSVAGQRSFTLPLLRTFSGATITYHYFFIPPGDCAGGTGG